MLTTYVKPFCTCPTCDGNGHVTYRVWGMDGSIKCIDCRGFGLVSVQAAETILILDN